MIARTAGTGTGSVNRTGAETANRGGTGAADRGGPTRERILLVFAKAPEPGRVKTRIAAELGAEEAARIYRAMGTRIVDTLRGGPWRTILFYDPPGGEAQLRRWLGSPDLEYLAQPAGGLGLRLRTGFEHAFRKGAVVCAVGTDAPELDRERVDSAFRKVSAPDGADVVFGPATDGGYYLVALRRPAPALFEGIPWSTREVLAASRKAALALGLRAELLSPLADVDRPEDIPEDLRSDRPG